MDADDLINDGARDALAGDAGETERPVTMRELAEAVSALAGKVPATPVEVTMDGALSEAERYGHTVLQILRSPQLDPRMMLEQVIVQGQTLAFRYDNLAASRQPSEQLAAAVNGLREAIRWAECADREYPTGHLLETLRSALRSATE